MEITPITIGILVAVSIVGYLLGLAEAAIKNDNKEKKESEDSAPIEEGSDGEATELVPPPKNALEPEMLAIFERVSGALKLRIDGEMVEYKSDLTGEQRERLLKVVVSLRPWIEATKEKKPLTPLPSDAEISTMPASLVRETVQRNKGIVVDDDDDELDHSSLSMVEQIDRILQKKLEKSPLSNHGIKLQAAPSGSLLIKIAIEEYEWIEDIPEQDIQDIIRESIAEWDDKTSAT